MRIYKPSILTVPLPDNLKVKLRISEVFHTFGSTGCELLFLESSLLNELITEVSSVNAIATNGIIESIRTGDQSVLGEVAYIGTNGDSIRALNPVSEIVAIGLLNGKYLPVLANVEAVRLLKSQYAQRFSEELPFGWTVVINVK